jgi:hypothetical protein
LGKTGRPANPPSGSLLSFNHQLIYVRQYADKFCIYASRQRSIHPELPGPGKYQNLRSSFFFTSFPHSPIILPAALPVKVRKHKNNAAQHKEAVNITRAIILLYVY